MTAVDSAVGEHLPQRITADADSTPRTSPPRLAIGEVIDRYRVEQVLGVGGMGMVVLKVAVAVNDPVRDRQRAESLLREARAMARLRAHNVRAVHDVGSINGIDYIAMEYIAGVDLARWLGTPRSVPEIVSAFAAAGRGLAAAHAAGVLHRDFKPSNVLVGDDGEVVVTDFGLSRWLHEPRLDDAAGTPHYRAPEANLSDPRADQYSFCVALGEALALAAPAPTRRQRRRLERLIRRGSANDAAVRHPSMTAVVAELEAAVPRPRRSLVAAVLVA
jgi:serine/threonine-protein kinase